MLKRAATWIASTSASSRTPVARTASASARASSRGRSVSVSRKPSVPRSRSSTGAVRQSCRTASQTSSPSAYDATAPWDPVQNGHWLSEETKAAKSSRSPGVQSDGPRMARSSAFGKRAPEELRPIVERLQDVGRLRAALRPDEVEDSSLGRVVTAVDALEPHRRVSSPAFRRSMPAATAADTVCSKISSSE